MEKWKRILVNEVAGSSFVPSRLRQIIYKFCGLDVQTKAIFPGAFIQTQKLKVGEGSWINNKCYFDNQAQITIGKHVGIGMEVLFCTSTHELGNSEKRASTDAFLPIAIEDGCWIGTRATILQGVTIGKGCVIAAGAIVNKNCEPDGMYAGVPARRIKNLEVNEGRRETY